jgi:hypothetical protein
MSYVPDGKKQTFAGFNPTTKQKNAFNVNNDFLSADDGSLKATLKVKTTDVTLATGATETDVNNFFPIGSVPLSIAVKVTTAITNNGFITSVGTDGDADAFCDSLGDGVLEELDDEVHCGATFPDASHYFTAADKLRLTTNANPTGGGVVKVSMFYIDGTNLAG